MVQMIVAARLTAFSSLMLVLIGAICLSSVRHPHDGMGKINNDQVAPLRALKLVAAMCTVNLVDTAPPYCAGQLDSELAQDRLPQQNAVIAEALLAMAEEKMGGQAEQRQQLMRQSLLTVGGGHA